MADKPTDLIPCSIAADLLGVTEATLCNWRAAEKGPRPYLVPRGKSSQFHYSRAEVLRFDRQRNKIEARLSNLEHTLDRVMAKLEKLEAAT